MERKRRIVFGVRILEGWVLLHAFAMDKSPRNLWGKLKMIERDL